jgi:hypothetical protein
MADQKISQLTTIVTVDTAADLFPIVDTSAVETKKITPSALKTALSLNNVDNTTDANKPVSSATQTALDAKQATLVSATNIKTINSTTILGSGNISVAPATAINATAIATGVVDNTEFEYLNGVTSAIQTQIDSKQATLVSATNIKTINSTTVLGAGNISVAPATGIDATAIADGTVTSIEFQYINTLTSNAQTQIDSKQATLVSATNIKTVNSTSLLGSGDVAVQATLVSGTNIKTINSTSLLGSGDIVLSASPSGVSGAIQFSNGSAFASDAANFFWDDTNNRLGVGTNAPTATEHIVGSSNTATDYAVKVLNLRGQGILSVANDGVTQFGDFSGQGYSAAFAFIRPSGSTRATTFSQGNQNLSITNVNGNVTFQNTPVQVVGSGSTSATTSLLVQDSTGQEMFRIRDNNQIDFRQGQLSWINPAANCWRAVNGGSNVVGTHWLQSGNFIINDGTSLSNFNSSVMLGVVSTTKGFLPPVMTTTQKSAISAIPGLVVYDSTTNKLCCYNGSTWNDLF